MVAFAMWWLTTLALADPTACLNGQVGACERDVRDAIGMLIEQAGADGASVTTAARHATLATLRPRALAACGHDLQGCLSACLEGDDVACSAVEEAGLEGWTPLARCSGPLCDIRPSQPIFYPDDDGSMWTWVGSHQGQLDPVTGRVIASWTPVSRQLGGLARAFPVPGEGWVYETMVGLWLTPDGPVAYPPSPCRLTALDASTLALVTGPNCTQVELRDRQDGTLRQTLSVDGTIVSLWVAGSTLALVRQTPTSQNRRMASRQVHHREVWVDGEMSGSLPVAADWRAMGAHGVYGVFDNGHGEWSIDEAGRSAKFGKGRIRVRGAVAMVVGAEPQAFDLAARLRPLPLTLPEGTVVGITPGGRLASRQGTSQPIELPSAALDHPRHEGTMTWSLAVPEGHRAVLVQKRLLEKPAPPGERGRGLRSRFAGPREEAPPLWQALGRATDPLQELEVEGGRVALQGPLDAGVYDPYAVRIEGPSGIDMVHLPMAAVDLRIPAEPRGDVVRVNVSADGEPVPGARLLYSGGGTLTEPDGGAWVPPEVMVVAMHGTRRSEVQRSEADAELALELPREMCRIVDERGVELAEARPCDATHGLGDVSLTLGDGVLVVPDTVALLPEAMGPHRLLAAEPAENAPHWLKNRVRGWPMGPSTLWVDGPDGFRRAEVEIGPGYQALDPPLEPFVPDLRPVAVHDADGDLAPAALVELPTPTGRVLGLSDLDGTAWLPSSPLPHPDSLPAAPVDACPLELPAGSRPRRARARRIEGLWTLGDRDLQLDADALELGGQEAPREQAGRFVWVFRDPITRGAVSAALIGRNHLLMWSERSCPRVASRDEGNGRDRRVEPQP